MEISQSKPLSYNTLNINSARKCTRNEVLESMLGN